MRNSVRGILTIILNACYIRGATGRVRGLAVVHAIETNATRDDTKVVTDHGVRVRRDTVEGVQAVPIEMKTTIVDIPDTSIASVANAVGDMVREVTVQEIVFAITTTGDSTIIIVMKMNESHHPITTITMSNLDHHLVRRGMGCKEVVLVHPPALKIKT